MGEGEGGGNVLMSHAFLSLPLDLNIIITSYVSVSHGMCPGRGE